MKAQHIHQLHVSRAGVVRDRDALGTGPDGPVLGRVRSVSHHENPKGNGWEATPEDGRATFWARTRHDALDGLVRYLKGR